MQIVIGTYIGYQNGGGAVAATPVDNWVEDEFLTPVAAGAINLTKAEPGPGDRIVASDTGNALQIKNQELVSVGTADGNNTGIWYRAVARVRGAIAKFSAIPGSASSQLCVGWDDGQIGAIKWRFIFGSSNRIHAFTNTLHEVATYTENKRRDLLVIIRDTGAFYFYRDYAKQRWFLTWIENQVTSSEIYAAVNSNNPNISYRVINMQVPIERFVPAPLVSDGFGGGTFGTTDGLGHAEGVTGGDGAGGDGESWTQNLGTWSNSGGKAVATALDGGASAAVATVNPGSDYVIIEVDITFTTGFAAIMARWVDNSNRIQIHYDGTNIALAKVVGGSTTTLFNQATTYVAGGRLTVIIRGTSYRVLYDGTVRGSGDYTISDGVFSGVYKHGVRTTNLGNSFDNFRIYAIGVDYEYSILDTILQTYIAKDNFVTTLPAGSVNGTDCEPGPGTRLITDTGNKVSITGGRAVFASGAASDWIDPSIVIAEPITPQVGQGAYFSYKITGNRFRVGFRATPSTEAFWSMYAAFGAINWRPGASIPVLTYTTNNTYETVIIFGYQGAFLFHRATGGNWVLLWVHKGGTLTESRDPYYLAAGVYDTPGELNAMEIRSELWVPIPLISDDFSGTVSDGLGHAEGENDTLGAGGDGVAYVGTNAVRASNLLALLNGVTLTELFTDTGLEVWTSPTDLTNWTEQIGGTTTINREASQQHAGTYAARFDIDASNSVAKISQTIAGTTGDWYVLRVWSKASTTGKAIAFDENFGTNAGSAITLTTSYQEYAALIRATRDNTDIGLKRSAGGSSSIYVDDFRAAKITFSDMVQAVNLATADVFSMVDITRVTGSLCGLVLNLNNPASPTDFVFVMLDGANFIRVAKCVAGVYSVVNSYGYTYVAGGTLKVHKNGTSYRIFYNDTFEALLTISDASIISNGYHGAMSTSPDNRFSKLLVYPVGNLYEYARLGGV